MMVDHVSDRSLGIGYKTKQDTLHLKINSKIIEMQQNLSDDLGFNGILLQKSQLTLRFIFSSQFFRHAFQ